MSLSNWLREYLYIALGGNRKGTVRTYVNLFLTMLLGGLWHGANWTFVLWGAWHGGILALERLGEDPETDPFLARGVRLIVDGADNAAFAIKDGDGAAWLSIDAKTGELAGTPLARASAATCAVWMIACWAIGSSMP